MEKGFSPTPGIHRNTNSPAWISNRSLKCRSAMSSQTVSVLTKVTGLKVISRSYCTRASARSFCAGSAVAERSAKYAFISSVVMPVSAEPMPMTSAPADRMAFTSSMELTPPQPMMGKSVTARISRMHFWATARTPLPDKPPTPLLSTSWPCAVCAPGPTVLIAQIASAPAATAAVAISPMRSVLGVNLGTTGMLTAFLTADTISATSAGSWPIAIP